MLTKKNILIFAGVLGLSGLLAIGYLASGSSKAKKILEVFSGVTLTKESQAFFHEESLPGLNPDAQSESFFCAGYQLTTEDYSKIEGAIKAKGFASSAPYSHAGTSGCFNEASKLGMPMLVAYEQSWSLGKKSFWLDPQNKKIIFLWVGNE